MSNETKIGLLAIIAIAVSIWGYKFVKGKNLLVTSNIYFVEYDNVDQLKSSSPVLINGFQVGIVADVYLKPDNYELIIVKLDLDKTMKIPKNTIAQVISTGFMGGKAVNLIFDRPCSGDNCAESGAYLKGESLGLLSSMVAEDEMKAYMEIISTGLKGVIDELNNSLLEDSDSPLAKSLQDMQATIANLKAGTARLNQLLASSSGNIAGTMDNLESLTSEEGKLQSILTNADELTHKLKDVDINKTLEEVSTTIKSLNETLASADQTLGGVTTAVGKINSGEGTLGKLMTDEALYQRLNTLSFRADSLISDLQQKPYRYMPFKSRKKVKRFDKKDANSN